MLKTLFPLSFNTTDVSKLIIKILIYLVASLVVGLIMKLFGWILIIGIFINFIGAVIDLYILAGIIITILNFTKVIE